MIAKEAATLLIREGDMAEWTSIGVPVSFKRSKPRDLSEG
jgi:hypothetical protein